MKMGEEFERRLAEGHARQQAQAHDALDLADRAIDEARSHLARADRAELALAKYGRHHIGCDGTTGECTCGLRAAMKGDAA